MYTLETLAGDNLPKDDPNWFTMDEGEIFRRARQESIATKAPVLVRQSDHYQTRVIAEVTVR